MLVQPDTQLPRPVLSGRSRGESLITQCYTALVLMRLTGMTRRQVTYWACLGLVKPSIQNAAAKPGKPSLFYPGTELVKALIVCQLRRAGFSPRQVQQVARNLEERGIPLYESEAYLLTDGYSVYYAFSDGEVVDIMKHHRQMLLLLPIHEQVAKLMKAA